MTAQAVAEGTNMTRDEMIKDAVRDIEDALSIYPREPSLAWLQDLRAQLRDQIAIMNSAAAKAEIVFGALCARGELAETKANPNG